MRGYLITYEVGQLKRLNLRRYDSALQIDYLSTNKRRLMRITNGGYGVGSSFQSVKELCKESKVLEGFEIKGGVERDGIKLAIKDEKAKEAETKVRKWLQKTEVIKNAGNSGVR